MKTIKLEIETDDSQYFDLQRAYSSAVRFCYKRWEEDHTQKEIDHLVREKFAMNSWLCRCANVEAKGILEQIKETSQNKIVFGGKCNLIKRSKNKITKNEWQNLRLRLITSQGEKGENSNRLFNFDLTNGLLIFKPDKHTKIPIKLLGIGRNRQLDLDWLQTQIGIIPITVQLSRTHCCIIFDDTRVENTQKIKGRTAGIDLNPNYIGFAIRNKSGKLVHTIAYDISKVEGNKQNFELIEITKDIQSQCRHFGVETFGIEKLNMKSKDHNKGRNYNRLVNNKWNRNLFVNQLEKRLKRIGIKVNFVLSEYSSWVGNLSHLDLFDPIASAAEIARRASVQYEKELCIWCPLTPPGYQNLWKEDDSLGVNWRRIIDQIKNAKLRYRVLLDHTKCAVSSFVSNKSRVMAICY